MIQIKPTFIKSRSKQNKAAWRIDLRSSNIVKVNPEMSKIKHFKTKAEAESFANELNQAQNVAGIVINDSSDNFNSVVVEFKQENERQYENKLIVFTYFEHKQSHADFWNNILSDYKINQIDENIIKQILHDNKFNKKTGKDYSPSYQDARLGTLKNIFKIAIKLKKIGINPVADITIEVPKYATENEIEEAVDQETYSVENFRLLIETCDKQKIDQDLYDQKQHTVQIDASNHKTIEDKVGRYRFRPSVVYTPLNKKILVSFAMQTGLRFGEQAALRWKHIDFDKKICHVRLAIRKDKNKSISVSIPKTIKSGKVNKDNKKRRYVPIPPSLIKLLKEWRLQSHWSQDDDLIFPKPDGTHRSDSDNWNKNILKQLCKDAGVPEISWHKMRHFYASLSIKVYGCEKMEDLLKVSARLGHASIDFTWQLYGHWIEDAVQDDLDGERLDRELFGSV